MKTLQTNRINTATTATPSETLAVLFWFKSAVQAQSGVASS
jgi:hypothetical protein